MTLSPPVGSDSAPSAAVGGDVAHALTTGGNAPRRPAGGRLQAVDAVRGLAALAVVLYHVPTELQTAAGIPNWLLPLFHHGALGVDAFFVLSGFVISMSVASGAWTFSYLLRFLARRSVRLDPSYWAAMALEVALGYVGLRFLGDQYPLPSIGGVLAHLVYLQGILRVPQISDVFWTLCFEIQFYLVLVGLLVVTNVSWVKRVVPQRVLLATVLLAISALSVAVRQDLVPNPHEGLAIIRGYQFALGIVTFLLARRSIGTIPALIILGGILGARLLDGAVIEVAVTTLAGAICFGAIRSPRLNALASHRVLQFLGTISYSLYLYHAGIVGRASTVTLMLTQKTGLTILPLLGLVGGILGSIVFSYIMYRVLEAPTMRLSKRIKLA